MDKINMATIEWKEVDAVKVAALLDDIEKGIIGKDASRWVILSRLRDRGMNIGYTQAGRYRKALRDNLWINKEK